MKKTGLMGEYEDDPNSEESKWLARFKSISHQITVMDIFECNDKFYHGNNVTAIKKFMETGYPENCLSDWLEKNWERVMI